MSKDIFDNLIEAIEAGTIWEWIVEYYPKLSVYTIAAILAEFSYHTKYPTDNEPNGVIGDLVMRFNFHTDEDYQKYLQKYL